MNPPAHSLDLAPEPCSPWSSSMFPQPAHASRRLSRARSPTQYNVAACPHTTTAYPHATTRVQYTPGPCSPYRAGRGPAASRIAQLPHSGPDAVLLFVPAQPPPIKSNCPVHIPVPHSVYVRDRSHSFTRFPTPHSSIDPVLLVPAQSSATPQNPQPNSLKTPAWSHTWAT